MVLLIFNRSCCNLRRISVSKGVLLHNLSYDNNFDLHVNEPAVETQFYMSGLLEDSFLNSRQLENGLLGNLRLHWQYPLNTVFVEMVQLYNYGKFDATMPLTLNK